MRRLLLTFPILCLFQPCAFAFCKNLPRLVCAEYSNSELVVIAKLVHTRHVVPLNEQDGFIYTLKTTRILKGRIGDTFRIYEENSSGRASFGWRKGDTYLLFLNSSRDGTWWLYGCGNSAPLKEASFALKAIDRMEARKGGLINGLVAGEHEGGSFEHVAVEIEGRATTYETFTNKDGEFRIHVPAGRYVILVALNGWTFKTDNIFTFEDPDDVRIENGSCAQVQFMGVRTK